MLSHRSLLTLVSSSFLITTLAFAGKSGIEADVNDAANGKPIPNAQVRIEPFDKKSKPIVVKPDAKGHITVSGLSAGSYRVTAVVDGKAQSVQTVKVTANASASTVLKVNKAAAKTTASHTGTTKSMYRPGQVGSRFGGYWHETGDKAKPKETGADDVSDGNAGMMEDAQRQSRSGAPPSGGAR